MSFGEGGVKGRIRRAVPTAAKAWVSLKERARILARGSGYLTRTFADIHRGNLWGEAESVSGPGSTLAETVQLRRELPGVLARLGVRRLVDAPCGDCHWISTLNLGLEYYCGLDIVPALIEANRARYPSSAGTRREFLVADLTRDALPVADAILCRDCLIHLSFPFIRAALRNFRRSSARYLLTTNYSGLRENADILSGQWRPIDLRLAPFHLPEPLIEIRERECEDGGLPLVRSLAVWPLRTASSGDTV